MAMPGFNKHLPWVFFFIHILLLSSLSSHRAKSDGRRRSLQSTNATAAVIEFLRTHNAVRFKHGVPHLKWSTSLANYAKWYANRRRGDCALIHSSGAFGENLFWGGGRAWKPADAVADWAAEEASYDYGTNSCKGGAACLHYTQIVWKNSVKLGCSQIVCNAGDIFIACEYYPPGNVVGQRPY
ncbi:hypothetical protein SAY86_000771 [Trapa natans]|uniref:SCP domain-containing protein n=1 Tax=Trapa natans TaxID=22666 RepID=A0AAN7N223_TRANT|nr:hypothetical protein SAY86_000771 [Trapa natans]